MNQLECVNLKKGLRINTDGSCKACCMMSENYFDDNDNPLNVKDNTFTEIANSKTRKKIIKAFNKGKKHPACKHCWSEEEAGKKSKRLRDNERHTANKIDGTFQLLDINMGTTCNIKCRTCGPFNSSFWNKEWFDLKFFKGSQPEYKEWLKRFNHAFDDDSEFWKEFENNLEHVLHIDFYGGEPFLVKKQWEMLEYAIEKDIAKNITLHYNTNGTIWDDEKYNILKHFKGIDIDFSIDGVKDKLNYVRYPADWDTVKSNLLKLISISKEMPKFNVSICNTISTLNVYYIDEMYNEFLPHTRNIYLNLVFGPHQYCIKNLPPEIKKAVQTKLETINEKYWVNSIINFMNSEPYKEEHWDRFLEVTKMQDEYRGQSFSKTFPEFYTLMKKNGYKI